MGVELKGIVYPSFTKPIDFTFQSQAFTLLVGKAVRVNQPFFKLLPNSVQCHIVVRFLSMELI